MGLFGDPKVDAGTVSINMSYDEYKQYKKEKQKEIGLAFLLIILLFFYFVGSFTLLGVKENIKEGQTLFPAIVGVSMAIGIFLFWVGYALLKRFNFPDRFFYVKSRFQRRIIRLVTGYFLITVAYIIVFTIVTN